MEVLEKNIGPLLDGLPDQGPKESDGAGSGRAAVKPNDGRIAARHGHGFAVHCCGDDGFAAARAAHYA